MVGMSSLDEASSSLDPLPRHVKLWLRAVTALGFISFFASFSLFLLLAYRLFRWQTKAKRSNQFVILIFNLVLADMQQSMAFLLNAEWLRLNEIAVGTRICWLQGWFVSTGDLASGVWCFTIGIHTFASVILNYRLKSPHFFCTIAFLWIFIYGMAFIGVGLHPHDLYVRAGAWCWVDQNFNSIRLWTHYFWIFFYEFGVIITYAAIYVILLQRIRSGYYTSREADLAKSTANVMVVYPIVYVICTLPLASSRMASMSNHPPSLGRLCLSAAMITSNGWLDVLLYTITRRILIFSDSPPTDEGGIDTFSMPWGEPSKRFGAATIIEATGGGRYNRRGVVPLNSHSVSRSASTDRIINVGLNDIKLVTTTEVLSEPAQAEDYEELARDVRKKMAAMPGGRFSEDSGKSGQQLEHIPD
ncbi:integral membrane protein-like protein [Lepidopterella palustris CBS 459.81]|uniref:Integral membrane protein-like protein n=1 Tax=Lepidopterella palustris CBS 459.81 TaxID=1314670 RepID=A0A8E2JIL6_9PEZI|nr:integral membrane protein-like protein [Lepidopterella palustris CBS 459.81]